MNVTFFRLRLIAFGSNFYMKHLISFTALLIWTISIGQTEISYVKTTVCNSELNGKPSGEITSEHYKGNGGNEEQFKMNGFINGKLNSSSFYWYSPDGDYGLDYNFSNEEEECVTTFNYSVLLRSEVLASFQYEIFDGALDPESSVRFIYFSDTLEYDREFKITPSLVNQSEQFIHNHIYDDTPFDFKFPEFDFSSVELLQHSFNRKTKSLENGHTIS